MPTGRVFATLTPLIDPLVVGQKLGNAYYGPKNQSDVLLGGCKPVLHQRMLLLWGKQQNDVILPETWTLEIHPNDQLIWKEVRYMQHIHNVSTLVSIYSCQSTSYLGPGTQLLLYTITTLPSVNWLYLEAMLIFRALLASVGT